MAQDSTAEEVVFMEGSGRRDAMTTFAPIKLETIQSLHQWQKAQAHFVGRSTNQSIFIRKRCPSARCAPVPIALAVPWWCAAEGHGTSSSFHPQASRHEPFCPVEIGEIERCTRGRVPSAAMSSDAYPLPIPDRGSCRRPLLLAVKMERHAAGQTALVPPIRAFAENILPFPRENLR